jgi:peptide/nickel transport system substrate-binding protein
MKPFLFVLTVIAAWLAPAERHQAWAYIDSPALVPLVADGQLPPLERRLPEPPLVSTFDGTDRTPGIHGGTLRMLMGSSKDTRQMVVYGYARLVIWTPNYVLVPDLLQSIDNVGDRIFTLRLRKGHRWSDGHPFTAEDFRYFWDDIINNKDLSPFGPPTQLLVEGERPAFKVLNDTTVRYSWTKPNPFFLPALAATTPLYIYRPAHYLKKFHAKYADAATLEKLVKADGQQNWAALHHKLDHQYRNDNPDLPTLDPWVLKTKPPSERFVFARNPYYHRVDEAGRQLPYIDDVVLSVADGKIIPAKTGAGESDLQARYIRFDNYTFLKESEKRTDQKVHLWRTAKGSHFALFPNLNVNDPVWRELMRDVRFRRALSLAINRHEINQVVYFGLAIEGGNTVLPQSPLFRPEYQSAWTQFDLKQANDLLDELGLTKRNSRGVRLLPDGRPLEVVVETAGESSEQVDCLELIRDSWIKAGIKLFIKPSQREVFRNRIFSGDTMMSVWSGLENGLATADQSPEELAPTSQQQLQWPKWGQYFESGGKTGEPVEMPAAQELLQLNDAWRRESNIVARTNAWTKMLSAFAEHVFSIGVISGTLQPVVVSTRLRNVPPEGIYNWEPGAHFGIYRPDHFWLDQGRKPQAMK